MPWTNKDLKLRWEHITSKLQPGAKDVWTAVVSGPDGAAAAAEMVATLYDASLDDLTFHSFDDFQSLLRSASVACVVCPPVRVVLRRPIFPTTIPITGVKWTNRSGRCLPPRRVVPR